MQERKRLKLPHKTVEPVQQDQTALTPLDSPPTAPDASPMSDGPAQTPEGRGSMHERQRDDRPKRERKVTPTGPRHPEMVTPQQDPSEETETALTGPDQQPPRPDARETVRQGKAPEPVDAGSSPRRPRWEERYTRVTLYVENRRLERLRELCFRTGKSQTNVVNDALQRYLERQRQQ